MMSLLRNQRRNALKAIVFWGCLMIPASAFLYSTNAHVRALEKDMEATTQAAAQEKESLRVLHAEWAYLNNPQRLAAAVKQHFSDAQVASAKQVLVMPTLSTKVAIRDGDAADPSAGSVQIAGAPSSPPPLLAKPIAYDGVLVALHHDDKAKLPSAVSWSQKMVSAFTSSLFLLKSNSTP